MKASVKFRDDRNPLFHAKTPMAFLRLPLLSGISAGSSSELRLDLTTAFASFPSLRVSYRPNDSQNPFSVVVKTGVGKLGSPIDAAMSISAEFGLVGNCRSPKFLVRFKPRIGDFCLKKATECEKIVDYGGKSGFLTDMSSPRKTIDRILTGFEVSARSVLPVKNHATVNFHWGLRVPSDVRTNSFCGANKNWTNLPQLAMSKISVEQLRNDCKALKEKSSGDVAQTLCEENEALRQAVEELRSEFVNGKKVGFVGGRAGKEKLGELESRHAPRGTLLPPSARNGQRGDGKDSLVQTNNGGKTGAGA